MFNLYQDSTSFYLSFSNSISISFFYHPDQPVDEAKNPDHLQFLPFCLTKIE